MNPRNRAQQLVVMFDGRVELCRGFRYGLPVFAWGGAPADLLTRAQLRAGGLQPGGQDPVALLVFRHVKPYARKTVASVERQPATVTQLRGLAAAHRVRRTCRSCRRVQTHFVPTSTRQSVAVGSRGR
jgi:hypothetical protein